METAGPLLPFFQWCETIWPALLIKESVWLFAVVEAAHLLGLAALGGCVIVVDLRLLGRGLTSRPAAELTRDVERYLMAALTLLIVTGLWLFVSEAVKCYYNFSFWVKITTLPVALAFTFTLRRRVAMAAPGSALERWQGAAGAASLALWFTVAAAGRWIGFS
jgi:hypothetical protein